MTNIYEKIAAIQEAVPRLAKGGEMDMGGGRKLKFLGIDTILDAVKPLLTQHKVIILPNLVDSDSHIKYGQEPPLDQLDGKYWSGKITQKSIREKVVYDWTWVDAENPESQHTVRTSGEAMDTQDKATGKAFTSCQKSMFIKVLELITGDPEIEDGQTPEPEERKDRGAQQREQARPTATSKTPPKRTATTTANPAAKRQIEEKAAQEADAAAPAGEREEPQAPAEAVLEPPMDSTPQEDKILAAKKRLVKANVELGEIRGLEPIDGKKVPALNPAQVNDIGLEVTGKTREKWITLQTDINKIAAHIEGMVAEEQDAQNMAEEQGTQNG